MSLANYIIICDSRIKIAAATTPIEKVCAASESAAQMCAHVVNVHGQRVKEDDLAGVKNLQHEMMEDLLTFDLPSATLICDEMIHRLRELEKKFI